MFATVLEKNNNKPPVAATDCFWCSSSQSVKVLVYDMGLTGIFMLEYFDTFAKFFKKGTRTFVTSINLFL